MSFSPEAIAAAQAAQRKWGVPASVTLAQFILESGAGAHMPAGSNNPFGIKAGTGQPFVMAATHEVVGGKTVAVQAAFRKFGSLAEAFDEHGRLLAAGKPYRVSQALLKALPDKYTDYVATMARVYATDLLYASKLTAIIARDSLRSYDVYPSARAAASPVSAAIPSPVSATPLSPSLYSPPAVVSAGASVAVVATTLIAASGAVPAMTTVNLAPLVDQVLVPLLLTVLTGFASWAVAQMSAAVTRWFHVKVSAQQAQVIENAIQNGINLAVHKVGVTLDAHSTVDVKNQAVAVALGYALPKVTEEMAAVGISPETLAERILARLPVTDTTQPPSAAQT